MYVYCYVGCVSLGAAMSPFQFFVGPHICCPLPDFCWSPFILVVVVVSLWGVVGSIRLVFNYCCLPMCCLTHPLSLTCSTCYAFSAGSVVRVSPPVEYAWWRLRWFDSTIIADISFCKHFFCLSILLSMSYTLPRMQLALFPTSVSGDHSVSVSVCAGSTC